ncbi:MAG TPA: phage integrase N-terminal domain-containing protein [Azonexus sp.]|nr:phage integrase N-terminal domain-containing protein [Azonexus sp.]
MKTNNMDTNIETRSSGRTPPENGKPGQATAPQAYLPERLWNELIALVKEHGRQATRQNKIVAHETTVARQDILIRCLRDLRLLGYKLETVHNLQQRHIRALAKSWEERGLSSSTIANRISCLRALSLWIGKPGMIQKARDFVDNPSSVRRLQATTEDKSWSAAGIDIVAMINLIEQHDWRVGLQLKLMLAFGLRRKEAVMFRPMQADLGGAIRVRDGTKGGRERVVMMESAGQRALLDFARSKVSKVNEHIGHPDLNLEQALRRFNYVLSKFGVTHRGLGVTAHGLRHQYLNDLYEKLTGVPSPVRTTNITAEIDQLTHDLARSRVSQDAGHARLGISNAYIGARPLIKVSSEEVARQARIRELIAKDKLEECERQELLDLVSPTKSSAQLRRNSAPRSNKY